MADRLYIEKKVNDEVVAIIDNKKILNLDKLSIERIDLFMFAMSLGLKDGKATGLVTSHGFILETSVRPQQLSLMTSLLAEKLIKNNEIEKVTEKDEVYSIAQRYANTGFARLKEYADKFSADKEEEILWNLLSELDDKYDELFGE